MEYIVTPMNRDEIDVAINWATKEGWNPGLHDAECFYNADPHGFFAGRLNGKIIAVGSAVNYDDNFAFCGFYIVAPEYRDQGYGIELTKARLNYVGKRNAGIDGVFTMVEKYKNIGYQFAYNNARYTVENIDETPKRNHPNIMALQSVNKTELNEYDRRHFPAYRRQFLECWINQNDSMALAYIVNNILQGYGVIRTCENGFKIAPLFAESPDIADILFQHLAAYANKQRIYIDIPENNPFAVELVNKYQMNKVFATARMYLKDQPRLAMSEIYGITSFELG